MAATIGNTGTGNGNGSTFTINTLVVGGAGDRDVYVVVGVNGANSSVQCTGVSSDQDGSLTEVSSTRAQSDGADWIEVSCWRLVDATTATHQLTISQSDHNTGSAVGTEVIDSDSNKNPNTATGDSTDPAVTITSVSADLVYAGGAADQGETWGASEWSDETHIANATSGGSPGNRVRTSIATEAGATSVDMDATLGTARQWAIMGLSLEPAPIKKLVTNEGILQEQGLTLTVSGDAVIIIPTIDDFPDIKTTATSNQASDVTSHTVNLPTGVVNGDLLLMFFYMNAAASNPTVTDWDGFIPIVSGEFADVCSQFLSVSYKISSGGESTTATIVSDVSEQSSHLVYRIDNWHGTTPPETSAIGGDTVGNTTSDPPSLTPSWGAEDTLWFASTGFGDASDQIISDPPNYSLGSLTASSGGASGVESECNAAARALNTATEDPGVFTFVSDSRDTNITVAVRPKPSPFPQVELADMQSGGEISDTTSWTLTYPTNLDSGNIITALVATDGDVTLSSWPTGWTEEKRMEITSPNTIFYYWKRSDGTETGNFGITVSAAEQGVWRTERITNVHPTSGPEVSTGATGDGTTPDPDSLSPTWGAENTLWFAHALHRRGDITSSDFPDDYTNTEDQGAGGTSGAGFGFGRRELNTDSENPTTFTISITGVWAAFTTAIRPRPFPQITATNEGNRIDNNTTHPINLPDNIVSGELLVALFVVDEAPTVTGWPTGWTQLEVEPDAAQATSELRFKRADGTEGSGFNLSTSTSQESSHQTWRITGHDPTTDPESAKATGIGDANPDPPNLSPTWGANNTLWIAMFGMDGHRAVTAWPTGYGSNQRYDGTGGVDGITIGSATRELNSTSDNPSAFTTDFTENWTAFTLAIPPILGGATLTKTVTQEGILQEQGLTKAVTQEGILQEQGLTKAVTQEGILQSTETLTVNGDAVLRGTLSLTVTGEGILQEQGLTLVVNGDAVLQEQGLTLTVNGDAVLRSTETLIVNGDAVLRGILTLTVNGEGILQEQGLTLTVNGDAILQSTATLTVNGDAVLRSTETLTVNGDAVLQSIETLTVTNEGILQQQGLTKAVTQEGILQEQGLTKAVTQEGILQSTETLTVNGDAVLQSTETLTVNGDAVLRGTLTLTVSGDAVLSAAGTFTKTVINEGILQSTETLTVTQEGILQEQGLTKAVSQDAILQSTETLTVSGDAVLKSTETLTVTGEGILQQQGLTLVVNGDAILQSTATLTVNGDAVLQSTTTLTVNGDAVLQSTETLTVTQEGILQEQGLTLTVNGDAVLQEQGLTLTVNGDAVLRSIETLAVNGDAVLRGTLTLTVSGDAVLSDAGTFTKTVINEGILQSIETLTVTQEGILQEQGLTLTVNGDAVLQSTETLTVSGDAHLQSTQTLTVNGDAVLRSVETLTVTQEGILQSVESLTVSGDAVLQSIQSLNVSADAVLQSTETLVVTGDGVLQSTETLTVSGDALLSSENSLAVNADAILKQTLSLVVSGDAELTATTRIVSGDAVLQKTISLTISGDARVAVTVPTSPSGRRIIIVRAKRLLIIYR